MIRLLLPIKITNKFIFFFVLVNSQKTPVADTRSCIKSRQIFGFLGFLGFALVYAMRVNLSVAIVSMVNQTAIPHSPNDTDIDECPKSAPVNSTFVPVSLSLTEIYYLYFFYSTFYFSNRAKVNSLGMKILRV